MDIDIDIAPDTDIGAIFSGAVRASNVKHGKLTPHPVGVYFQNIPADRITDLAAIPYTDAATYGFFKFDFLNLHALQHYTTKKSVRDLAEKDPNWNLLLDPEVVTQLFHISKHYDIVSQVQPRSVEELADCLALIRPGKRNLLEKYIRTPHLVKHLLYERTDGVYSYKRSHAIAYALVIVLQLHTLDSGLSLHYDDQLEW